MVTVKLTGGLGNILYQIAACIAYAKKWNMQYAIPTATTHSRWKHYRFPGVHYEDVDIRGFGHYRESAINYSRRPYDITFREIPYAENLILEGHFLSHKYFWDYRDEIFAAFGFKWQYIGNVAAIHVRRGDYLTMQEYLPVLPFEYYRSAIALVIKDFDIRHFIFFSDDINFCKENIDNYWVDGVERFDFSDNRSEIGDLELMSCCPLLIAANSTYSLWSHYLSKHDRTKMKIICPSPWYGPAYGPVDIIDMLPKETFIMSYL